jgi:hypothetical protein
MAAEMACKAVKTRLLLNIQWSQFNKSVAKFDRAIVRLSQGGVGEDCAVAASSVDQDSKTLNDRREISIDWALQDGANSCGLQLSRETRRHRKARCG